MLQKLLLMSAIVLALTYPKRPIVITQGDPIPVCPPYCDDAR
jgi:hypothetical protein